MDDIGTPESAEDNTVNKPSDEATPDVDGDAAEAAEAARLDAYDLNKDGKISMVEDARARLGIVDAHMEEVAEQGGIKGKLAEVAHQILDRIDNDDQPSTDGDH